MTGETDKPDAQVEELEDKGFEALSDGDFDAALEIAEKLEQLSWTGAFEIRAQAHAGLGDLDKAIEELERGVAIEPRAWRNWQLLGNYRSDKEKYEKAAEAYKRALECPNVWADCVRLNQAVLAGRRGDNERALELLNKVSDPDPELSLWAAGIKVETLEDLGRKDEALALAEEWLEKEPEFETESETEQGLKSLARIAASHGRMTLEKGGTPDIVRCSAMEAIKEYGSHHDLLALIRRIDGRYSANAQHFRLTINGILPQGNSLGDDEIQGYLINYQIIAESVEQAFEWAREFESFALPEATLSIEKSEPTEQYTDEPMGVYWRSGEIYYTDEDDEDDE